MQLLRLNDILIDTWLMHVIHEYDFAYDVLFQFFCMFWLRYFLQQSDTRSTHTTFTQRQFAYVAGILVLWYGPAQDRNLDV